MAKNNHKDELPRVTGDTVVTFRRKPQRDLKEGGREASVVDAVRKLGKGATVQRVFQALGRDTKTAWQDTVWILRTLAREGSLGLRAVDAGSSAPRVVEPIAKPAAGPSLYVTAKGIAVAFSNDAVLGRLRRVLLGKGDAKLVRALSTQGLVARDKRGALRVDHNEMILTGVLERMRQIIGGGEAVGA